MTGARKKGEWPVALVWLALAAATAVGFGLAEEAAPARIATSIAIVLAGIKINLVFEQYMDLRWRHRPWRHAMAAWLVVVTVMLLGTYWAT